MGARFTITEQEKATIRGLYEQTAPAAAPAQAPQQSAPKTFVITKVGMSAAGIGMSKFNGQITINGDNLNFKQDAGTAKSDDTVKIVDKQETPGSSDVYNCVGKIGMNDKHTFTVLYSQKLIKWESISSFNNRSIAVWMKFQ
jgi:hypothetical protein